MEENQVKISSLSIKKLYGHYSYQVKFNTDVTFLFGNNGCGKTTILNITEAIITGNLFKLFEYEFETIELKFHPVRNDHDTQVISITNLPIKQTLHINFENIDYDMERIKINYDNRRVVEDTYIFSMRTYFNYYPFLMKIRDTFNYVYLPLSRSASYINDDEEYHSLRRAKVDWP